jgi:uncharacterized protein (TIGR02145 family)
MKGRFRRAASALGNGLLATRGPACSGPHRFLWVSFRRRLAAVVLATAMSGTLASPTVPGHASPTDPYVPSILVGQLQWMTKNLTVTRFANGDEIPDVADAMAWADAGRSGRPARSTYANAAEPPENWGMLYNYAVLTDPRGLCPDGWRLPSNEDWTKLEVALGGGSAAPAAMKSESAWPGGKGGTNASGFAALPAGFRTQRGEFFLGGRVAYFWARELAADGTPTAHMLFDDDRPLFRIQYDVAMGMSVRCVRDWGR